MPSTGKALNGRDYILENGFYNGADVKKYYGVDSHDLDTAMFARDSRDDVFSDIFWHVKRTRTNHSFYIFADFGEDKPLLLIEKY